MSTGTPTTPKRTGNRRALPSPDLALKVCAECGRRRGTVRRGWQQITREGVVIGWTCPECPQWAEPIRREVTGDRVRFVAVVGVTGQDGRRQQLKRRFPTVEAAREWVEEARAGSAAALASGRTYTDPSQVTVQQLCDAWIKARSSEVGTPGGVREVTINGYRSALNGPLRHLADVPARQVTPGRVEAVLRTLAREGGAWGRPLSHRTLVYSLLALRQAFAHGVREGVLSTNPASDAKAPRARHQREDDSTGKAGRWTVAELSTFRECADAYAEGERFATEPWIAAGMRLTLCGLRRSEVLGLDWQRVDLDAGAVEVAASRVKTGRGSETALGDVKAARSLRTVEAEVIHPGTSRVLRALWLAQGRPEAGLVVRDSVGEPVAPDLYSRRFRALCGEAGVPVLRSVHNVRHTLATSLKAADVPDHEASALLGHDVATYQRFYLVTDDDGAASAARAAGRLFAVTG